MDKLHNIQLEKTWLTYLEPEFQKEYMAALRVFLANEKKQRKTIFPPGELIFNTFNTTPFDSVKVVILGQDPYHGDDQAHGLSFSVPEGVRVPPSLINIFKEVSSDLGVSIPASGCLESWAAQGVLLLNAVLTVERGSAGSHAGKGWELFTDSVIELLNNKREGLVFLLWGSYAQKKGHLIDTNKHCVLKAPHPSPLSAHRGFLGCKHFSKANDYLRARNETAIDWNAQ